MNRILFRVFASRPPFVRGTSSLLTTLDTSKCSRLVAPSIGCGLQSRWNSLDTKNIELVYENRFSFLVTRLKSVSLITCGLGLFGMPVLISMYSGDLPAVKQGALAFAAMMSGGTTTVALAFVFDPYVHYIEKIPIRQCHAKIDLKNNVVAASEGSTSETTIPTESNDKTNATTTTTTNEESPLISTPILDAERLTGELKSIPTAAPFSSEPEQPYLLRAITKNILLMTVETVFDPNKDIKPYDGFRPIANFAAKNKALYVHPEFVFDENLRKQLSFLLETKPRPKAEDDDD